MTKLSFSHVQQAAKRIEGLVKRTPIMQSTLLNDWLGHSVYFKAECLQKTGAFKLRGASNFIATLDEQGQLPKHIVANSSGNHAQAVAYAAKCFNIPVTIFAAQNISPIKAAATKYYGAELKLFPTRTLADQAVKQAAEKDGTVWIPPYDHPHIICGQGTAAYEALQEVPETDAIFAPCGGGGLLSGTYLSAKAQARDIAVIGAEPLNANDAAKSRRAGRIIALEGPPSTLADGAATPHVGVHTFEYVQAVDQFYEVSEQAIIYWTQWLHHLLKLHIEPTCAMTMQALVNWLQETKPNSRQNLLVIVSGGNISAASMTEIWQHDMLTTVPSL